MERLLTITEVAADLKISYQRVSQIIAEGNLKVERVGKENKFVRIRESEFKRYQKIRNEPKFAVAQTIAKK